VLWPYWQVYWNYYWYVVCFFSAYGRLLGDRKGVWPMKTLATYPKKFCCGTLGGKKTQEEPAQQGPSGRYPRWCIINVREPPVGCINWKSVVWISGTVSEEELENGKENKVNMFRYTFIYSHKFLFIRSSILLFCNYFRVGCVLQEVLLGIIGVGFLWVTCPCFPTDSVGWLQWKKKMTSSFL